MHSRHGNKDEIRKMSGFNWSTAQTAGETQSQPVMFWVFVLHASDM